MIQGERIYAPKLTDYIRKQEAKKNGGRTK